MTCCHFFCSAVFSMPVWRYPMVGAADSTVSPSSSSTSRKTPCVLGCWGPMLTVMTSVLISGITAVTPNQRPNHHDGHSTSLLASHEPIAFDARPELLFGHLQRFRRPRRHANLDRIILPQRESLPVLRHQQAPRIRMAVELDAEQVPHLALEPVGGRPDAGDGRHVRVVSVEPHFQAQPLPVTERHEDVHHL